ncbi:MAG: UPF0182 family protein [Candidatus Bathyarchaeia archaeon]
MERRTPISTGIFIFIMFIMIFSSFFGSSPLVFVIGLMVAILAVFLISKQRKDLPDRPSQPEYFRTSRPPIRPLDISNLELPRLGRWIIIPIAIIGVIAFILYQNWWLDVSIFQTVFNTKAALDWWNIQFLNNHYFYAGLGIGLLIAISDPRISITREMDGSRRIYLHSKFLGVVRILRSQLTRYSTDGSFTFQVEELTYDDKVSLKLGLAWKALQFLIGAFIIGPPISEGFALQYLIIAKWIETQQLSWIGLLQRTASILSTRLFTSEMPTGTWLIENSPVLEFITWLKTPITIFCVIWGLRFAVSLIFGFLKGDVPKVFRSIVLIGLAALTPIILPIPTSVFDITTPFYVRSMVIGEVTLIVLAIFFSLRENWVQQSVNYIFRRKILLTAIVLLVSISVLSGPIVVAFQYAPAMEGNWKSWVWEPQIKPTVEYTQWATGLQDIVEDDLEVALNTGKNLDILSNIRVFNDEAAKLRLKPQIGVNWMDIENIDVIWLNEREYWVSALKIVLPPTQEDPWRSERLIVTHSERILALDAASGEILTGQSVFNLSEPASLYYGEGGLFESSDIIYVDIPNFLENHLPEYTGPPTYVGEPDYVLSGFNRYWFFSGMFGREALRWDFARGDHGEEVKMLFLRDVRERISPILLPGMTVDDDPYLVSDGENLYYALYVYIDRDMPTEYLDYPDHKNVFLRNFAVVLINTYDGSIDGYFMSDEENYVLDFYRSMYPQWNQPTPSWLQPQLRYPEFLLERQIDADNKYHVIDPDVWQGATDFFELTTDASGNFIEDVRYVVFSLNKDTYWASVRLVQKSQSPALNLAAMYVALNGESFGNTFLLRGGNEAVIGPQTAVDAISNFSPTKSLLSLHPNWRHGNVLMYVVDSTLHYFVPFYAKTETTLAPAMMASVNALTQDVGYYVIESPQDATEVRSGSEKAYLDLVGVQVEVGAEERKNNVIETFEDLGYTITTPQQVNANVDFLEGSVNYREELDRPQTEALITSYVDAWAKPNNKNVILLWETVEADASVLNFGVLVNNGGIIELHYITVTYTSG